MTTRIPVCEPYLAGNELRYVTDALQSTWISSAGKYLKGFEEGFAAYLGLRHGIATTNGTTAMHLSLAALGIGPGDEVIIPEFTMIATAFAVCYCGAMPVFVDADPETWTIDVRAIERKITSKTKAILPVHIYGHPADMDPIRELAKTRGIYVVEDAAEAHGAEYKGKKCGALSDIAAFSFYANKVLTAGEGGMVVTNDDALADKSRYFKNLCFPTKGARSYNHEDIGFNYRMSNLHAAIGLAQLEKVDFYIDRRRHNAKRYNSRLDSKYVTLPVEKPWAKNCYWMYGVVLTDACRRTRDEMMSLLEKDGVETRPFFIPMSRQPALRRYGANVADACPVSERLSQRGFYLPSGSNLTDDQIDYVSERLMHWTR